MLSENNQGVKETQDAFLSDLEREFSKNYDIDKRKIIPKDKANLVILYIVTAYKKKFAKFISKMHTRSFILAGITMAVSTVYYVLFVLPFAP